MSPPDSVSGELDPVFEALGLSASSEQRAALIGYLDLLQRWNATYNLTSVRDRAAMRLQHLADCLAAVEPLRRQAGDTGRALDVGSGGGLPGVVFAVMLPEWDITCVDTVGKKVAFLRQVAGTLGLSNLHAAHARVEALKAPAFDLITCRAFASLSDFTSWTRGLLQPKGAWLALKGQLPADEMAALPADVQVFHVEHLAVPGLQAERCLVWMRAAAAN